uniref:Putative transcriptional regulator, TetR family n=1 Tax=Magnetococcus massalia (strain MO-1) TaxID=451514 RepID=A0A1S7LHL9_MAGMO|nr:Putative transcriptional regulator, TetR family [Candidatus Magnetococcus massalia]
MGVQDRKAREFARRERDILDAALELLDRPDWLAVTVADIAEAAEIGKGTVYKHFPSKETLYAQLSIEFGKDFYLTLTDSVDMTQPVIPLLRQLLERVWELHLSGKKYHRMLFYCSSRDFRDRLPEDYRQEMEAKDAAFEELFAGIIQRGIDEGVFPRSVPVQDLMLSAHATFEGGVSMLWNELDNDADRQQFTQRITQFMLAGMCYMDRQIG